MEDILELRRWVDNKIEIDLIRECAPTLAGLKTANLFNYKFDDLTNMHKELARINELLNVKLRRVAVDDVVTGTVFVHQFQDGPFDARALFADGVVARVGQAVNALRYLLAVHAARCHLHVVLHQFVAVVSEVLELNALGVGKKEQVDRLVDGLHHNLPPVVVLQDEAEVLRDEQPAQLPARSLNAQLLKQRHTQRLQDQVVSVLQAQFR